MSTRERIAPIHRESENGYSRQPGFRHGPFSETQRHKQRSPRLIHRGLLKVFGCLYFTRRFSSPPQNLLVQWFVLHLRGRLEPVRVLAVCAFPCTLRATLASSRALRLSHILYPL